MDSKINIKIVIKTLILFPLFMIFIMFPLCVLIVLTAFIPKGRILATKLYEFFGWIGIVLVGIKLNVVGLEKIDTEKSYVVIGNHPSTLDIFTHITALPVSIRFLTKTELFRIPIFGRVLKTLGLPRIDRKNAKANFEKINESINQVVEQGNSIMIFPEGKRSNQKKLLPFKKGAAHIAKDFNLPILPIVSHNAHNLMIKGKVWFIPGDIHLDVLDPLESNDDLDIDKVTELLFERIDQALTVDK